MNFRTIETSFSISEYWHLRPMTRPLLWLMTRTKKSVYCCASFVRNWKLWFLSRKMKIASRYFERYFTLQQYSSARKKSSTLTFYDVNWPIRYLIAWQLPTFEVLQKICKCYNGSEYGSFPYFPPVFPSPSDEIKPPPVTDAQLSSMVQVSI